MILLVIFTMLVSCHTHTLLQESQEASTEPTTLTSEGALYLDYTTPHDNLTINIMDLTYVRHFRRLLLQLVAARHTTLTRDEKKKIIKVVQEFLKNFAAGVRVALANRHLNRIIDDRLLEESRPQDDLERSVQRQLLTDYPDLKEITANEIVYRLRYNLGGAKELLRELITKPERNWIKIKVGEMKAQMSRGVIL